MKYFLFFFILFLVFSTTVFSDSCSFENGYFVRELVQDPTFENGLLGYIGPYGLEGEGFDRTVECQNNWVNKISPLANRTWYFNEITQTMAFCDNPRNPIPLVSNLKYESSNGGKYAFLVPGEKLEMYIDTSKEWNGACALGQRINGVNPPYPGLFPDWEHFLITTIFNDGTNSPNNSEVVDYSEYDKLIFSADITLTQSQLLNSRECGEIDGHPEANIEMLYINFVFEIKDEQKRTDCWAQADAGAERACQIESLIFLVNSFDGTTNYPVVENIDHDFDGSLVYFAPNFNPTLRLNQKFSIDNIDIKPFLTGALVKYRAKFPNGSQFIARDYKLQAILAGWEIRGEYKNKIEINEISVKGHTTNSTGCGDEICDGVDNDGINGIDNGCDDDLDGYADNTMTCPNNTRFNVWQYNNAWKIERTWTNDGNWTYEPTIPAWVWYQKDPNTNLGNGWRNGNINLCDNYKGDTNDNNPQIYPQHTNPCIQDGTCKPQYGENNNNCSADCQTQNPICTQNPNQRYNNQQHTQNKNNWKNGNITNLEIIKRTKIWKYCQTN